MCKGSSVQRTPNEARPWHSATDYAPLVTRHSLSLPLALDDRRVRVYAELRNCDVELSPSRISVSDDLDQAGRDVLNVVGHREVFHFREYLRTGSSQPKVGDREAGR